MQTVWVTGAAGFTGRFMTRHLRTLEKRVRVVGLDLLADSVDGADTTLRVDLSDADSVRRAAEAEPPSVIIHLAGLMPPHSEEAMRHINVDASITLANAVQAAQSGNIRLICSGSAAEYDRDIEAPDEDSPCNPAGAYGRSKNEQTTRLLSLNSPRFEVVVARAFNLVGPGLSENLVAGGLCRQFLRQAENDGVIAPKGPIESVRDFIDVRDVVAAYWLLATAGNAGEIYNICSGEGTSIARLIEVMQATFGVAVDVQPDYDPAVISADVSIGQNRKISALGWRPQYSLEDSIAAMAAAVNRG